MFAAGDGRLVAPRILDSTSHADAATVNTPVDPRSIAEGGDAAGDAVGRVAEDQ